MESKSSKLKPFALLKTLLENKPQIGKKILETYIKMYKELQNIHKLKGPIKNGKIFGQTIHQRSYRWQMNTLKDAQQQSLGKFKFKPQ